MLSLRHVIAGSTLFLCSITLICCNHENAPALEKSVLSTNSVSSNVVVKNEYAEQDLISFLNVCSRLHKQNLTRSLRSDLDRWAEENELLLSDSSNQEKLCLIELCHLLLTTTGASNGTPGLVLDAPYMWHWVKPNPRHAIISAITHKTLAETKPPAGYGKYRTYADIDRRPLTYLSDLFSDSAKYSHPELGEFYGFGWCSEREMAFSTLMQLLNFDVKIVVSGNHCWSEIKLKMNFTSGIRECILHVDNTFNVLSCSIEKSDITYWNNYAPTGTAKWYNTVISDSEENKGVKNLRVSTIASSRIEAALTKFFDE